MYYDRRGSENNSNESTEMFLDLSSFGTAVESASLMAAYHLPKTNSRNLEIRRKRICAKANKMDSKFSIIKDHVTLRRTLSHSYTD